MNATEQRMKDPLFCTDLAMRYHSRRWSFIHHLENWALFLAALVPLACPFVVVPLLKAEDGVVQYPWWLVIAGMCYMAVWFVICERTAKEDPWTRTKFSRRHRDAKKRFGNIEQKLVLAKDADEIASAAHELSRALCENPLQLRVLAALTYNECLRARGEEGAAIPVRFLQRLCAPWCDVHADLCTPVLG